MTARRRPAALVAVALLLLLPLSACDMPDGAASPLASDAPVAATPPPGPFTLGVQTHFGQGWPARRLGVARDIAAPLLRDGLSWQASEPVAGRIALDPARVGPLDRACAGGMKLMLVAIPRHQLYDGGRIVTSPQGRAAFAAYLDTLARRFGDCLIGIEVGNEINGARALPVADAVDPLQAYVDLMATLHTGFAQSHPDVALVGGSTNAVGTGFLTRLFRLGLLDHVDGVAVHPYRDHGENVDWEIARLNAAMARHGKVLPIWASEIGDTFEDNADAPAALLKKTTLLAAAGVRMVSWYALVDQKWFPDMGLAKADATPKPAAATFALLQRELLPHGRPVAVSDDRLNPVFRYGADRWVLWGARRDLLPAAGSRVLDAAGRPLSGTVRIGTAPVVVIGPRPRLGPRDLIADSLLEFDAAPWSYAADGHSLEPVDTDFATRLSRPRKGQAWLSDSAGAVTGGPVSLRYTAPRRMEAAVQVCVEGAARPVIASLSGPDGKPLGMARLPGKGEIRIAALMLDGGQSLTLDLAKADSGGTGYRFRYRMALYLPGALPPHCPDLAAGWRQP